MSTVGSAPHPGTRIRAEVIPPGMSVTKAAQLMGVGRPALSNLLNGNASLSADMAMRLEKAFNKYPLKDLMEMQARYDAAQAKQKRRACRHEGICAAFLGNQGQRHRGLGLAQHPGAQSPGRFLAHAGALDRQRAYESGLSRQRRCRAPRMGRVRRGERRNALGACRALRLGVRHQRGPQDKG